MLYGHSEENLVESIGYQVTINLKNGKQIIGYLYTIDPETGNVVLYSDGTIQILMSDPIQTITVDRTKYMNIDETMRYQKENPYTQEWLDDRRQQVITYLQKNHIPLEVKEGVIHVLGCAQIEPPFAATSVVCENNLIRKRVRDLLLELV